MNKITKIIIIIVISLIAAFLLTPLVNFLFGPLSEEFVVLLFFVLLLSPSTAVWAYERNGIKAMVLHLAIIAIGIAAWGYGIREWELSQSPKMQTLWGLVGLIISAIILIVYYRWNRQ